MGDSKGEKKAISNLKILNQHLSHLHSDLVEPSKRNSHTNSAGIIGELLGSPSADVNNAFNETVRYFNEVEAEYYSTQDHELQNYLEKVRSQITNIRKEIYPLRKTIEEVLMTSIFVAFFISGLFFLVPKITGGVIGASKLSTNVIGIALIFIGVIGFFMYNLYKK